MEQKSFKSSELTREVLDVISSSISFSNAQINLENLFNSILDFNNQTKYVSFFEFYSLKDTSITEKNLRVRRTRLNKILEQYDYEVNGEYKIIQTKELSFQKSFQHLLNHIKKSDIKEIRILDSFGGKQKEYLYDFKNTFFIKEQLKKYKFDLKVISILDNEKTKAFYQDILTFEKDFNIQLKYLRFPIIVDSPIFFVLIKNRNNENHFFYYEETTKCSMLSRVNKSSINDNKLYKLLDLRFNYFFNSKELESKNFILPINNDMFLNSFSSCVNDLINSMQEILYLKNLNEEEILSKTNELIKFLLQMKVSFPSMKYSYSILYHHIKLLQTTLLLENTDRLEHTEFVVESFMKSNVFENLSFKLISQTSKEHLLLKNNSISKNNLKEIRNKIICININKNKTLVDIFDNMLWNTAETIKDSFNNILQDIFLLKEFIYSFINIKNKENLSKTNDMLLFKCIARIIMNFYGIDMPKLKHIIFEEKEIELLKNLHFINKDIEKNYYEIVNDEKFEEKF